MLLGRGVWLYFAARLFVLFPLALAGDPLVLPVVSSLWFVMAVGLLSVVDLKRRHETLLFANLGVSRGIIIVASAVPALIGEILIALARGLLT